ncbi:MAG: magnesium and cobalt transport protein CorA [Bacteroidetes bacterium CG2_30_33_31]|nr:MAG: magnesium and cobalt transport protein CorA [Bacteroidetes bacterium CG2_30_33_31]
MDKKSLNRKKINPLLPTFTGKESSEKLHLQLFEYNVNKYLETPDFKFEGFNKFSLDESQHWLNIHGIHDVDQIVNICNKFGIHNLVVHDILDVNQRPKFEEFSNYYFFSIKSILPLQNLKVDFEQLSIILGENFLVTFQEKPSKHFEHIRNSIRENIGVIRQKKADYLLYLILESILDNYFIVVDNIESQISKLTFDYIKKDTSPEILNQIEEYKNVINQIIKTINPIKEIIKKMQLAEKKIILKENIKYFSELEDLCLMLLDNSDKLDVRLESNKNLFFSIQSQRMNQVMKTLTVVSTIFIPLTFIVGLYGMNFHNMPEINWKFGYLMVWIIILLSSIGMIVYFRRKKWF